VSPSVSANARVGQSSDAIGRASNICAILTVRDRRELTLRALRQVLAACSDDHSEGSGTSVSMSAVVVDDGSTDGTAEAIESEFGALNVSLLTAPGDAFWAAGMAMAEAAARMLRPDYVLWLNDDVALECGAIQLMIGTSERAQHAVVVGATRSPADGRTTYSGLARSGLHPLSFTLVEPGERPQRIQTFNGNVVLVPIAVLDRVGGIDGSFAHAYADIDFGLRLTRAGTPAVLAPGHVGTCVRNSDVGTWRDKTLPGVRRVRLLHSPKGAPPRSSARFLTRHGGPAWPIFFLTPYVRIAIEAGIRHTRRARRPR